MLTPSTPKQLALKQSPFFFQSPLCIQKFMSKKIKLLVPNLKTLAKSQQQGYLTPIFQNITIHTCPIYIFHGCDLITSKKYKLHILDNLKCFYLMDHLIVLVFYFFPTNLIKAMVFRDRLDF